MSYTDIVNAQADVSEAGQALQFFTGLFASDVVGIWDEQNYTQLFASLRPMRASIAPQLKIMDHPIETGAIRSDFAIIMPIEIEFSMMLVGADYASVYKNLRDNFNAITKYTVHTKLDVYTNMIVSALPHEESADPFNAAPFAFRMREIQTFESQYQALKSSDVATSSDQSTVNTGVQQAAPVSATVTTASLGAQALNFFLGL